MKGKKNKAELLIIERWPQAALVYAHWYQH